MDLWWKQGGDGLRKMAGDPMMEEEGQDDYAMTNGIYSNLATVDIEL